MALELTILGSAGSRTGPGRACSGYLVTAGDTRVMLDCGNGSTANLQRHMPFDELDAVVITHRHADHCVDLIGMYYGLKFHQEGARHVPLYAAPEVLDMLTAMLSRDSAFEFKEAFPTTHVDAGDRFTVGDIEFELFASRHPVPTVSVRMQAEGKVLTYSSDSYGGPELLAAARDADLFLCEATWQGDLEDHPAGIHLTARAAGEVAREAGVGHLLLTHLWPDMDRDVSLEQCAETFDGPLDLAEDNQVWVVP